jgi:LCP family protein required for cell wall assembly
MIYVHIKPSDRTVTLLSIPRDLYVNNRKINAVHHSFGMEELKRQLANITGYEIDYYVLIDMYAFIDVIDLIGGVDVTLDETVIDPSYRTFDNGVWSTLYYPPGTYHLSGKQALRLARSRHYSSDFKRAERQQLILESLKNKALDMNAGDADKFLDMVATMVEKTETDMPPQDILKYFFRFKNYTVRRGHVLSTGNVLYSKMTKSDAFAEEQARCDAIVEELQKEECVNSLTDFDKGAYVLLPLNDNWQVIKWYTWQAFES